MLRDQRNAYALSPIDRRNCLQNLAIRLSGRDEPVADEITIREILQRILRRNFHVLSPEERVSELERLSEDLRRSATLTRAQKQDGWGWKFSHNSLREYLVVESILHSLKSGKLPRASFPISEAMRRFVTSLTDAELDICLEKFKFFWRQRLAHPNIGKVLEFFWDGFIKRISSELCHIESLLSKINDGALSLSSVEIEKIDFDFTKSKNEVHLDAGNSTFKDLTFKRGHFVNANFAGSVFDTVIFMNCHFTTTAFCGCWFYETVFDNCSFERCDFNSIVRDSSVVIKNGVVKKILQSDDLIGWLKFHGMETDAIDDFFVVQHEPKFPILEKIVEKLCEQNKRQLLGLTQKGSAQDDPNFARALIKLLERMGWVAIDRNDLVGPTAAGRNVLGRINEGRSIPPELVALLQDWR